MSFAVSRLRPADRIVAAGAVGLFVFMIFFAWLGASGHAAALPGTSFTFHSSLTGWEAFTVSRWIWLATILAALTMVVAIATQRKVQGPVSPAAVVTLLGGLSTLLILYRIVDHAHGSVENSLARVSWGTEIGIWLALIASAAITYGGSRAMREAGATLGRVRQQAGDAP
jgi:hypothetical protein